MDEKRNRRTAADLEANIAGLASVIDSLPEAERARLNGLMEETRQRHAQVVEDITRGYEAVDELQMIDEEARLQYGRIGEGIAHVHNELDDVRLNCKYRVFDAEARQREALETRRDSGDARQVS